MSLRGKLPSLKDKANEQLKKETPKKKIKVASLGKKLGKKTKK